MTDLDEERADLNALIREAHEATKDLKQASRDLDARIRRADEIGQSLNKLLDAWAERLSDLAQQNISSVIDQNLTPIIDQRLFDFPPDMARRPTPVNRLDNQVLVREFADAWGKYEG